MAPHVHARLEKIRAQMLQLQNEVEKAEEGLKTILNNANDFWKTFEDITSTQTFLRQYTKINSIIKDYIVAVEEINCRIDLLEINNDECDEIESCSIYSEYITAKPQTGKRSNCSVLSSKHGKLSENEKTSVSCNQNTLDSFSFFTKPLVNECNQNDENLFENDKKAVSCDHNMVPVANKSDSFSFVSKQLVHELNQNDGKLSKNEKGPASCDQNMKPVKRESFVTKQLVPEVIHDKLIQFEGSIKSAEISDSNIPLDMTGNENNVNKNVSSPTQQINTDNETLKLLPELKFWDKQNSKENVTQSIKSDPDNLEFFPSFISQFTSGGKLKEKQFELNSLKTEKNVILPLMSPSHFNSSPTNVNSSTSTIDYHSTVEETPDKLITIDQVENNSSNLIQLENSKSELTKTKDGKKDNSFVLVSKLDCLDDNNKNKVDNFSNEDIFLQTNNTTVSTMTSPTLSEVSDNQHKSSSRSINQTLPFSNSKFSLCLNEELLPEKSFDFPLNVNAPVFEVSVKKTENCKRKSLKEIEELVDIYDIFRIKRMKWNNTPGTKYSVVLDHINSPGEFFVQFVSSLSDFKKMRQELILYLSEEKSKQEQYTYNNLNLSFVERKGLAYNIIGHFALYYCSLEDELFRVQIKDWRMNDNDDMVSIWFVDYGDPELVSLNTLKPLPLKFEKYYMFAVKCHLSGVYPVDTVAGGFMKNWYDSSTKLFQTWRDNHKELLEVEVCEPDGCYPHDSLPIVIYTESNSTFNDILCLSECAVKLQNPPRALSFERTLELEQQFKSWDPMKEDHESIRNDERVDTDHSSVALYGYVGTDEARICKFYAKEGYCYKGVGCKKEHVPDNSNFWTTDKKEVVTREFSKTKIPSVGDVLNIEVMTACGINKLYCIKIDENKVEKNEENLETLVQSMNKKENVCKMKKLIITPSVGEIVIGQYADDEMWYRAKVLSSNPDTEECKILFVDYGNSQLTPLKCLREIENKYIHLPFQVMECYLENIELDPNADVDKASQFLMKLIDDGNLKIKVLSILSETVLTDDILRLSIQLLDGDGFDVGELMVAHNVAIMKPVPS